MLVTLCVIRGSLLDPISSNALCRYAYGGTDGAIHIAEEIPRPSKNIPKAMYVDQQKINERVMLTCLRNLTMAIGFATAFPLSLALMFGIRDIVTVLDSSLPSAEIFYQITGSAGLTTFLMCWVIVVYYCM